MKFVELYGEYLDLLEQEDRGLTSQEVIEIAFFTTQIYATCDYCNRKGRTVWWNNFLCKIHDGKN